MNSDHLRERTRSEHQATESLMPLMSASLTRHDYIRSLQALYRVLRPWEDSAAAYAPEGLESLVAARRRSALLEQDLLALGAQVPSLQQLEAPSAASLSRAGFLGRMYVVEGSTLGGQYIARHVASVLGLQSASGAAYFHGYGDRTGALWTEFKKALTALPDAAEDEVVAAAREMFAIFAASLQQIEIPPPPTA